MAVVKVLWFGFCFVVSFVAFAQSQNPVLLDLNVPDNTTLDYIDEYLDINVPVFLFDRNNTNSSSYFISPLGGNWTDIYLVILNGSVADNFELDIEPDLAEDAGRIESRREFSIPRTQFFENDADARLAPFGFNTAETIGMHIMPHNNGPAFDDAQLQFVLYSIALTANVHPGYQPREYCIVAQDSSNFTTACVTLYFIGRNDDPPVITYVPDATRAQFTEGQSEFVSIISGSISVTDQDHPTRYLLMSATATIADYASSLEQLAVSYEVPGISSIFDNTNGVLTISGNGTTQQYSQLLAAITYHNNMSEPIGFERTISLVVYDGMHSSAPVDIVVDIINVNDPPVISLDGAVATVTNSSITYIEGSGEFPIVPRIVVVDTDPSAMIQRATVRLNNIVDSGFERIDLTANLTVYQLNLTANDYYLELRGLATAEVYTTVLRSLVYSHSDASPGNPSPLPARVIMFSVEDDTGASNVIQTTLYLTVQPVNDPPILSLISDPSQRAGPLILDGNTETAFAYLEDDPALTIGGDIYLRDVDSDISMATLFVSGLIDGAQDRIFFTELNGLSVNDTELGGGNRTITLTGVYSPAHYEMVLQTLAYENRFMNNSVTDGRRSIVMVTQDTAGAQSSRIVINVDVMDRNDGPQINIGQGVNMDHMITYIENGDSIPITQTFLTDLSDEEGHNISRLTVQLIALNGYLDPNESLFFRTPGGAQFIPHIDLPFTSTYISISLNSSVEIYEQALESLFYINTEAEPLRYNSSEGRDLLQRAIIVEVTDTNFIDPTTDPISAQDADMGVSTTRVMIGINIEPRNDNRPRILINTPDNCATDSDDFSDTESSMSRRRRDVRSVSRIRKRSISQNSQIDNHISMSPQIISAVPTFTESGNPATKCLEKLIITFNADTNTPLVEITAKISETLTFDPPELENYDKFGIWLDHRTLVVRFLGDCAEVVMETTSGKERPIFVAFEASQGDCGYTTPCDNGLCFFNRTGCPLVNYVQLSSETINQPSVADKERPPSKAQGSSWSRLSLVAALGVVVIAIALLVVTGFTSACKRRRPSDFTATSEKKPMNNHVEDVVIVNMDTTPILKESKLHPPKESKASHEKELKPTTSQSNKTTEKSEEKRFTQSQKPENRQSSVKKVNETVPKVKRKPTEEARQATKSCDQSHDPNSREHSSSRQTVQNTDSEKLL